MLDSSHEEVSCCRASLNGACQSGVCRLEGQSAPLHAAFECKEPDLAAPHGTAPDYTASHCAAPQSPTRHDATPRPKSPRYKTPHREEFSLTSDPIHTCFSTPNVRPARWAW